MVQAFLRVTKRDHASVPVILTVQFSDVRLVLEMERAEFEPEDTSWHTGLMMKEGVEMR